MTSLHTVYVISLFYLMLAVRLNGNADSLYYELNQLDSDTAKIDFLISESWSHARSNPRLSFTLLHTLDSIIIASNTQYRKDVPFYYRGIINKNLGNYGESEKWLNKYYTYHAANNSPRHLAIVTMALANLYSDQGLWGRSMNSVTESLNLYTDLNDSLGIIRSSSKLGYILTKLNRNDDALKYHKRSLELSTKINHRGELARSLANIGNTYEQLNELDSALVYFFNSEQINETENDNWGLTYDKFGLARVYRKKDKLEKGLDYARQGLQIAEKLEAPSLISMSKLGVAELLIGKKSYDEAIDILQPIVSNHDYEAPPIDLKESHKMLYMAYKDKGDIKNSFYHLEIFKELSDTLLNQDIINQINNLEVSYQTKQKEQEILLLNAEKELTNIRLEASNRRNLLFAAGLALLGIFSFFLFQLFRKIRTQKNSILKALGEKETLLREIHHRVKNNLQVVSSLLYLQGRSVSDDAAAEALQEGQNRVKSMSLIHQKLYQEENLTSVDVKDYFEKLIPSIFNSYNISPDRIKLSLNVSPMHLDVDTLIPVGLIVNELITNSLKHGFNTDDNGVIDVELREKENQLYLRVSDNGIGMTDKNIGQLKESFGYELVQSFSDQLDADINIKSDNGTSVEVNIKDYKIAS